MCVKFSKNKSRNTEGYNAEGSKLMGQVNLVRLGRSAVQNNGKVLDVRDFAGLLIMVFHLGSELCLPLEAVTKP